MRSTAKTTSRALSPGSNQPDYGEIFGLKDLSSSSIDDRYINEFMSTAWVLETPVQPSYDGEISSSSERHINILTRMYLYFCAANPSAELSAELDMADILSLPGIEALDLPTTRSDSPQVSSSRSGISASPRLSAVDTIFGVELLGTPATNMESLHNNANIPWTLDSVTTPTTWEPLALAPRGSTEPESSSDCGCLLRSMTFLERLAARSGSREYRIDLLLSHLRSAIETFATFIACKPCTTSVEQNMLLVMAVRQISLTCTTAANCYKAMHRDQNSNNVDPSLQQKPDTDDTDCVDILVSSYRVNRQEKLYVLESLITVQIQDFQHELDEFKKRYLDQHNQCQAKILSEAESQIRKALENISSTTNRKRNRI
jgi:hypothetical protein